MDGGYIQLPLCGPLSSDRVNPVRTWLLPGFALHWQAGKIPFDTAEPRRWKRGTSEQLSEAAGRVCTAPASAEERGSPKAGGTGRALFASVSLSRVREMKSPTGETSAFLIAQNMCKHRVWRLSPSERAVTGYPNLVAAGSDRDQAVVTFFPFGRPRSGLLRAIRTW